MPGASAVTRAVMRLSSASRAREPRSHDIDGVDAADDAGPVVGALALAHAGCAEVGHDGKILPDGQTGLVDLLAHDGVGFAQRLKTVTRVMAPEGSGRPGRGRGTVGGSTMFSGRPSSRPTTRTSSLYRQLDGLAELKLQILGQAAHVVVGLHAILRLQDVGIDSALGEKG